MPPRQFNRYMLVRGAGRHMKLARFSDSERCAWVFGILGVAAGSPIRGYLIVGDHEAGAAEVAVEANVSRRVAQSAIEKLKAAGGLVYDDEIGAWYVHDWWDVNPDPKKDPTGAERQARLRARRREAREAARNGGVTA